MTAISLDENEHFFWSTSATKFTYDGNRRLIRKERPSSRSTLNGTPEVALEVTQLKYDEGDRLIREEMLLPGTTNGTEVAKLVTEYLYNELNQIIRKVIKKEFMGQIQILDDATFNYRRLLDAPSQLSANNTHAELDFTYENKPPFAMTGYSVGATDLNNVLGIIEGEFSIESDLSGGIKKLRETNLFNPIFENEFDLEGRLTKKISRYNGHRLTTTQSFDGYGRKIGISHDSGVMGLMSYDELDRVKSINYFGPSDSLSEVISYDIQTGNLVKIERELGSLDLTYDEKDQLQSVIYSGSQGLGALLDRELSYDRSGNRINDTFSGEAHFIRNTVVEDQNYRYYSDSNGFGNIVQRTDKETGGQQVYDYWTDGKLRKFTKYEQVPSSTKTMEVDYYFDALGRRIAKKIKTRAREFTQTYSYLANQDKILLAKNGEGKVQLQVDGQGIDEHWAQITKSGIKTFISDHLGTIVNSEITNEHKITGAFGEVLQNALELEPITNPLIYGYTGRQYEPEMGLYNYRNRNYDPNTGRFMSKDPIGIQGGDVNLYRYCLNNPTNCTDPLGLFDSNFMAYMNQMGVGAQVQRETEVLVTAYGTAAGAATAVSLTPFIAAGAVQAAPIAGAAALTFASNPQNIENTIDFADNFSGALGGPTTGLPPYTPGGALGFGLGAAVNETVNMCK